MPRMKNRHTLGLITAGTKWNSGMKTRRASSYIHFKIFDTDQAIGNNTQNYCNNDNSQKTY